MSMSLTSEYPGLLDFPVFVEESFSGLEGQTRQDLPNRVPVSDQRQVM
jgi:hypothetical protein